MEPRRDGLSFDDLRRPDAWRFVKVRPSALDGPTPLQCDGAKLLRVHRPSSREYSWAAARFESEHGKLNSFEDITRAFRNQGGKFMEGF